MLTSSGSNVKPDVLVITVPTFAILGSTSNCSATEFQSSPSPARSGYPPVAPLIASVISVSTYDIVAKFAVFTIPWTFVVARLWFVNAVFVAASAATRSSRYFAIEGFGSAPGTSAAAS